MLKLVQRVVSDESGASAAEYAVLVALTAGVVVLALPIFGTGLSSAFSKIGVYVGSLIP